MSSELDTFVRWASELQQSPEFYAEERDYKLELGKSFSALSSPVASEELLSWLRKEPNNIVRWTVLDSIAKNSSVDFGRAAGDLLGQQDLGKRLDEFGLWLEDALGEASGSQTTLASVILMGSDPTMYPPYRTRVVRNSMKLAGLEGASGPPSERYLQFLNFCDAVVERASELELPKTDRLDVQGACWVFGAADLSQAKRLLPHRIDEIDTWLASDSSTVGGTISQPKWWVNQGISYKAARDESYIWAPQVTKTGSPVAHHTAVRDVQKGDVIVHYSDKHIRAIGTAQSDGYAADRPRSLPGEEWESEGWRADVSYRELEEPVPLDAVPEELRLNGTGPFTSVGGVRQGYLFELSGEARTELSNLASSVTWDQDPIQVGGVYVGNSGLENLRVGLEAGTWGWPSQYDEQAELVEGDLFLLAYGGGGRLKIEDWVENTAKQLHVCRVTKTIYESDELLWPDETDERRYPYRIGFELLTSLTDLDYRYLPLEVNKVIQTSSTKQGRVFVVEVDEIGELLETLGVKPLSAKPVEPEGSIADVIRQFAASLRSANVDYGSRHDDLVRRFVVSLATKRFLILTGLSGSGKTKLAQAFGEWLGNKNFEIIPVRPDWTSPDFLLGYRNELARPTEAGSQPWEIPAVLELILRAATNPSQPYLLILDEMNLAHVERYFAEVLSGIESDAPVIPNVVGGSQCDDELLIRLPANLFIVGTVNVDETTYMFSPKVLDRANTIEFRVETDDLGRTTARPTVLAPGGEGHIARFLTDAKSPVHHNQASEFTTWVRSLHALLSKTGREFGHRTYTEMMEFRMHFLAAAGSELEAFDIQVLQKVLPRIHGSQRDVGRTLLAIAEFCFKGPDGTSTASFDIEAADAANAQLKLSFDKASRMWNRLQDTHFVSFAE